MELVRLGPSDPRPAFDCGNKDLNSFFLVDSIRGAQELMSVTYVYMVDDHAVAYLSLSNDAIKKEKLPNSRLKRLLRLVPHDKQYASMPAVKIGRLATCLGRQSKGVGTAILDYMKVWFTDDNKTGCRFIIVDADNNERTINFYRKNGFDFLLTSDKDEDTRFMYFDLITFAPE